MYENFDKYKYDSDNSVIIIPKVNFPVFKRYSNLISKSLSKT